MLCVGLPSVLLSELCVIVPRCVLPKQSLAGAAWWKAAAAARTPQHKVIERGFHPYLRRRTAHFNLVTQTSRFPVWPHPDLLCNLSSPFTSISFDPRLPRSCSFLHSDISHLSSLHSITKNTHLKSDPFVSQLIWAFSRRPSSHDTNRAPFNDPLSTPSPALRLWAAAAAAPVRLPPATGLAGRPAVPLYTHTRQSRHQMLP